MARIKMRRAKAPPKPKEKRPVFNWFGYVEIGQRFFEMRSNTEFIKRSENGAMPWFHYARGCNRTEERHWVYFNHQEEVLIGEM